MLYFNEQWKIIALFWFYTLKLWKTWVRASIEVALAVTMDTDVERKQPHTSGGFQTLLNSSIDYDGENWVINYNRQVI